jgi:rod shape determining protein RodA
MLYWAGTRMSLLVMLASPAIGLILAFSTAAWGAWIILLFGLLVWWRPYVWEGLAVMLANIVMGVIALPAWRSLAPYQQNRLLAFLNPEVDPRAAGWHVIQSKIAIGSGGFLGKGFGDGTQKRLAFLPAQHTDFVFSVVGEELGFVGVAIALVLFVTLLLVLLRVARRAVDPYSSLIAFVVLGLFFTHIVENVGMTVNLCRSRAFRCRSSLMGGRSRSPAGWRSRCPCGWRGSPASPAISIRSNDLAGRH